MGNKKTHITMPDSHIGVIIPVYNTEKYLKQCLESVVNQTMPFYEIILINDGSTDNSLEICKEYADQYKNIKIINQHNKGLAATRNEGISSAKSEWLIFVDSDDLIDNNLVEIVSNELAKNTYDVLYYNARICNEVKENEYNEKAYVRCNEMYGREFSGMEFFINSYKDKLIVSACCAVYNRDFLIQNMISFPEGLYFEDNLFFIKAVSKATKVKCISNQLYIRRYREGSITVSTTTKKKCLDLIHVYSLILEYVGQQEYDAHVLKVVKQYIFDNFAYVKYYIDSFIEDREVTNSFVDFGSKIEMYFYEKEQYLNINWNDTLYLFFILSSIKEYSKENIIPNEFKKRLEKRISDELRLLNLNDKTKKIGIYGIGKHTEALLKLYKKYVEEINCDLFFIVTDINLFSYNEKPLYSVYNIPNNFDSIIISSLVYQEEIYKSLIKENVSEERIRLIYSKENKIDITWIN